MDLCNWREQNWRRAAFSRLRMELAGIAFARKHGFTPEDYARHLWGQGAVEWMGKPDPTAAEYLMAEVEAFHRLYPSVRFEIEELSDDRSQLTFQQGTCLGGWGVDQWGLARRLGLGKGHVCRYCREAFRVWARQLGLEACTHPQMRDICILRVERPPRREGLAGEG